MGRRSFVRQKGSASAADPFVVLIRLCLLSRLSFLFPVALDQPADKLDQQEEDQKAHALLKAIAHPDGIGKEEAAAKSKPGQDKALKHVQILALDHQADHHGDVHDIQADDADFIRLPRQPLTVVDSAKQAGAAHPHDDGPGVPEAAAHHADDGGFDGKVVLRVDIAVELRLRTHAARGDGIEAAARGHDQAVCRAKAADGDKDIDQRTGHPSKDARERNTRQCLTKRPGRNDRVDVADRAH